MWNVVCMNENSKLVQNIVYLFYVAGSGDIHSPTLNTNHGNVECGMYEWKLKTCTKSQILCVFILCSRGWWYSFSNFSWSLPSALQKHAWKFRSSIFRRIPGVKQTIDSILQLLLMTESCSVFVYRYCPSSLQPSPTLKGLGIAIYQRIDTPTFIVVSHNSIITT